MKKVTKAVILCGGFGTRFLPATKVIPKEMFPIVDTPTLEYNILEAANSGMRDILVIINDNKEIIKDYVSTNSRLNDFLQATGKAALIEKIDRISSLANIHFFTQNKQLGSGDALLCAKDFADDEPIAVLFGDDVMFTSQDTPPVSRQLADIYEKYSASVVGCQATSKEIAAKCGVMSIKETIIKDRLHLIDGIVEKPTEYFPSLVTSLGRFVLDNEIFNALQETSIGKSGELWLTDAIGHLATYHNVYSYQFDAIRYDIGSKIGYIKAQIEYGLRNAETKAELADYLKSIKL